MSKCPTCKQEMPELSSDLHGLLQHCLVSIKAQCTLIDRQHHMTEKQVERRQAKLAKWTGWAAAVKDAIAVRAAYLKMKIVDEEAAR